MNQRLFGEDALTRRGQREPLDGLLRVTAPQEWLILTVLALGFVGLVLWSIFGIVERVSSANCILARPGPRYAVASPVAGTVVENLVNVGADVEVDQPIAKVSVPDIARRLELARATVTALAAASDSTTPGGNGAALTLARAELALLESAQQSAQFIPSDHRGELTTLTLVPGQFVAVGQRVAVVRTGDQHDLEAVGFVNRDLASSIEPGMSARVRMPTELPRGAAAVSAQVVEVSDRPAPVPDWLQSFGLNTQNHNHQIRLAVSGMELNGATDGQPCEFLVVTDRLRPIAALGQ